MLAWNLCSTCLSLPSVGIIGMSVLLWIMSVTISWVLHLLLALTLSCSCFPLGECIRGGNEQTPGNCVGCGVPLYLCPQRRRCRYQTSLFLPIQGEIFNIFIIFNYLICKCACIHMYVRVHVMVHMWRSENSLSFRFHLFLDSFWNSVS